MSIKTKTIDKACVSYDLRRAEEERCKAGETGSARDRALRLEMAAIFEARAQAAQIPVPARDELLATLH